MDLIFKVAKVTDDGHVIVKFCTSEDADSLDSMSGVAYQPNNGDAGPEEFLNSILHTLSVSAVKNLNKKLAEKNGDSLVTKLKKWEGFTATRKINTVDVDSANLSKEVLI